MKKEEKTVNRAYVITFELDKKKNTKKYLEQIETDVEKAVEKHTPSYSMMSTVMLNEKQFKEVEKNSPTDCICICLAQC